MFGRDQSLKSLISHDRKQLGFILKDNSKPLENLKKKQKQKLILKRFQSNKSCKNNTRLHIESLESKLPT